MTESELRAKVMAQRRYIDVLVESERQRRRYAARPSVAPSPTALTPLVPPPLAASPRVHALLYGYAVCGTMRGVPKDWPEGHRWARVDELEIVTCEGCQAMLRAKGQQ